jgi:hypothetical protein
MRSGEHAKVPAGPHRNDLRHLAMGLRRLEKQGFEPATRNHVTGLQFSELGSAGEVSGG